MVSQNVKVHGALFMVALIYGANYSIAKLVTPEFVLPFGIIVLRVGIAGLMFWVIQKLWVNEKVESIRDYVYLAICASFGVAANQLMFFKGLSITTPVNASLIMTTTPILVLIASAILIKEKFTWKKMAGVMLGLIGAIKLIGGEDFSFGSETISGDVFIFFNAMAYGTYLVLAKPLMKKYHALTIVKWTFFFGFFIVLPFGFQDLTVAKWSTFEPFVYYCLAFIVFGTTFLAYLFNAWGLKYVNSSVVGIYIYLQPVLATFFALLFGQAVIDSTVILSSLLIFSGVFLVSRG